MATETHPHTPFIPAKLRFLILGSFPGRAATLNTDPDNQWFYAARRNQFWKIMEGVFTTTLSSRKEKEALLSAQGIGMTDVLLEIRRKKPSNLDQDLEIITFNDQAIRLIIDRHPGIQILFTSRFVETCFHKLFPDFQQTALLPSPSPRYARLSLADKIRRYKQLLEPL